MMNHPSPNQAHTHKATLVVHGGAWNIPEPLWKPHIEGVAFAARLGFQVLQEGGSALDAVEASIVSMEDNPIFDAGYGSVLNREGRVQLDAALMRGSDLALGGVAALESCRHPIKVARCLLEEGEHTLLVGSGADAFARTQGFPAVENALLTSELERENFLRYQQMEDADLPSIFAGEAPSDTVGAIALDAQGCLAAGNSTGGTPYKAPGRVGDSPLPGCGLLADERTSVACTGWGEAITRTTLASRVSVLISMGYPPQAACDMGLAWLYERTGARGGAIALSLQGVFAASHNTSRMAWAAVDQRGQLHLPPSFSAS